MNAHHARIEAHASRVQQEIRKLSQQMRDEISVNVGWMLRSMGSKRGWVTRKNNQKEKIL
ncbi:hypothetical protein UFOVP1155_58 [uncultured Caudovirales phage]|uniref:Uncharacterized protein n=1 Tax=uncultured Caudovirales phage TaxID=2100421 RepID=A0A6J5QV92_9CAUD|nr:hypothetical protein UFOVP1155_58 [uncultured Caudovirales phage]